MNLSKKDNATKAVFEALASVRTVDVESFDLDEDVFRTYGYDSLQKMRVLVKIEEELDVTIGDDFEDFDRIQTLRGLLELVRERSSSKAEERS